jgi:signal transduction histidine kinase
VIQPGIERIDAGSRRVPDSVPSGIAAVGSIPWGSHICQLYRSSEDLVDVLVPYFMAGLRNHEKCLWITSQPLPARAARDEIVRVWPGAEECLESGQLVILDHERWYLRQEQMSLDRVCVDWLENEAAARREGYRGLRITGNTSWLERGRWSAFCDYEAEVQRCFHERNIVALCSYTLEGCSSSEVVDVLRNHQLALLHRDGKVDAMRTATATLSALDAARGAHDAAADAPSASRLFSSLHAVTSALFDATTLADIGRAVATELAQAAGASRAALLLWEDGRSALRLIAERGLSPRELARYASVGLDADLPVAHAFRSGRTLLRGAAAVVPLSSRRARSGVMELEFARPRTFSVADEALFADLARQVSTALERVRLAEELQETSRRKDEFFAVLAHELRAPLAPIMTALHSMQRNGAGSEKERGIIERQAQHLSRLVDDLLDVSRIAQGKVELRKERVELTSVLISALEIATPLIEERKHWLSVDAPTKGMLIEVDSTRFAQVLANVLLNAAKFTERGGRISIECRKQSDWISIAIRDTGIGIPREMQTSIFDPFVQVGARPHNPEGLGLGLALVKSLTELHGGTVSAASEGPGRGSTFTVRIRASEVG